MNIFKKNKQYIKFCAYGFLKNLRFFDAFLLLFFLENNISYTQIGILYAFREVTTNFSEIPSGLIADTYGRKNALIAAFLAYIISFVLFYFSTTFPLFLVAMVLFGIGDAFRSGTHKGMIMDYLKLNNWGNQKINYYGHTRSWSQRGSAVSALFAGGLVFYFGTYRNIFLYSIIPYLFNFINIYTYPEVLNHASKKGKEKSETQSIISTFQSFWSIIKKPQVLQIINSAALHSSFLKTIKDYIQPLMVQVALLIPLMMHMDAKRKSGLIIGVLYFFIFLLTAYASRISAKMAKLKLTNISKLTLLAGFIAGTMCGLLYSLDYWIFSLFAFIVIFVIENIRKPWLTGAIADNVPNEMLTSVLSAQSFYRTILTVLLAPFLGILVDRFGIGPSFIIISSLLLLFTLGIGRLRLK